MCLLLVIAEVLAEIQVKHLVLYVQIIHYSWWNFWIGWVVGGYVNCVLTLNCMTPLQAHRLVLCGQWVTSSGEMMELQVIFDGYCTFQSLFQH